MPDTPTTALVKTATSPALARVSSQLALTDKLLTKPEEPFLIPYRKGKKWGFCDRNKNIVLDCVWDEVKPFKFGLAVVGVHSGEWFSKPWRHQGKNFGVIDVKGNFVFKLSGYQINIQSKNIIELWKYVNYDVEKYWDNLGQKLGHWRLFDCVSQEFVSKAYDRILSFSNGIYKVGNGKDFHSLKFGLVNSYGNEIVPTDHEVCNEFYDDYSTVKKIEDEEFYSIINLKGEEVFSANYSYMDAHSHFQCIKSLFGKFSRTLITQSFARTLV